MGKETLTFGDIETGNKKTTETRLLFYYKT